MTEHTRCLLNARPGLSLYPRRIFFGVLFFFSMVFLVPVWAVTGGEKIAARDFPLYAAIKPNFDFWVNIFTTYSKSQGVIHDTRNLEIIYEVVRLDPSNTVGAKKKNKKIKKAIIKKYKEILLNLSKKKTGWSKEEKRVATLFKSQGSPSVFKTAAANIRCQTGLKEEFKAGLARSGAVIDYFKKTFESHGLPTDLAYLPCVESSFNFKAYSKFGAAGIWQFTRSTGRRYMKIGYVVDERRDPYISTEAAARLLKKNYAELRAWPLAITAYNHGLAGMRRAKQAKGGYENIFRTYRSRSFKFASRNFYSEFLAARIVAENPKRFFGPITYHKPVRFKTLRTKGYLSVKDASDILSLPIDRIRALNPSLRKPVFTGQKYIPKGFLLRLPHPMATKDLHSRLAAAYRDHQKPSRFHRVQKGDTAGSIARLHSVRLSDLILANGLNRRAVIYIGQNVRIPTPNGITPVKHDKPAARSDIRTVEKKTTVEKVEPLKEKPKPSVEKKAVQLKAEMPVNPEIITGNLKILQTDLKSGHAEKNNLIGVILVKAEETLGHYADWLRVTTREIRSLNNIRYGNPISVNQKIMIPLKNINAGEFEEQRYEFHKELEEDFFESYSLLGVETYKVKNGDNTWEICSNELEIPFWLLKKFNPKMDFSLLRPLQEIQYPLISKKGNE